MTDLATTVPPPDHDQPAANAVSRLLAIMAALRTPGTGCPWDLEQDFATIAPYTLEEAYEVADAIQSGDWSELRAELGDLLFQVVFHAQIAQERGLFDFTQIADTISDKMIARHPHVFGPDRTQKTAARQTEDWEATKAAERALGGAGVLDGVARALPALVRARKLQDRAARVGFDWPDPQQVLDKIVEEAAELTEARTNLSTAAITDEMGDLLFAMANLARHLGVDPEAALRGTNDKFTRRFTYIEQSLAAEGLTPADADLSDLEALWTEAKLRERAHSGTDAKS